MRIIFRDENDITHKIRSLRKYCPKAYKELIFNIQDVKLSDGRHKVKLPTYDDFKNVYGQIYLDVEVRNEVMIIDDIMPNTFLNNGYKRELKVLHGLPYANERDEFKIKLMKKLMEK